MVLAAAQPCTDCAPASALAVSQLPVPVTQSSRRGPEMQAGRRRVPSARRADWVRCEQPDRSARYLAHRGRDAEQIDPARPARRTARTAALNLRNLTGRGLTRDNAAWVLA